jgi:hypothetical protein
MDQHRGSAASAAPLPSQFGPSERQEREDPLCCVAPIMEPNSPPPAPLDAVMDTNVMLDIYSCHDLANTYSEAQARRGSVALDDRPMVYRRARARESFLLALCLDKIGATTYSLHFELVALLTARAPPAPGGQTIESDFTRFFVAFVKERLLPHWNARLPQEPGNEAKNEADLALVAYCKEHSLPLITNEGYSHTGIVDEGMRKLAKHAGVGVFTPREFYQGKMNEAEEIEAFLGRFRDQAAGHIDARKKELGEDDKGREVLAWIHGYYRHILLGETEGRDRPVRLTI